MNNTNLKLMIFDASIGAWRRSIWGANDVESLWVKGYRQITVSHYRHGIGPVRPHCFFSSAQDIADTYRCLDVIATRVGNGADQWPIQWHLRITSSIDEIREALARVIDYARSHNLAHVERLEQWLHEGRMPANITLIDAYTREEVEYA